MNENKLPPTIKVAGDPRERKATWILLPVDTSDGQCSQCAVMHEPDEPHNRGSLAYQYSFYAEYGRWPTWLDAMAHCDAETKEYWIRALREHGVDVG